MTSLAMIFGFVVLLGVGFYFLDRYTERSKNRSHRHWQPDVDKTRAEIMKNLETPPDR
ncbi:hypothetical protein [Labrenzia sp. 011]|uniref:hypothetical protein n=1 Tax=Labrenzia sp. 011 TaxID=2171494 RepID=UPI001402A91C|nr:hypothetical protein [Labrenzia sp. 011]